MKPSPVTPARDEASPASRPVQYLGFIDAMRGLGVLAVVMLHSSQRALLTGHAVGLAATGGAGVQLFYVASAFTLFLSLDGRRTEAHPTRNFFLRRYFRIAPAFYAAVLLTASLSAHHPRFVPPLIPRWQYWKALVFLHGTSRLAINRVTEGGWSVADEVMFYLMLPGLHRVLTTVWRCAIAALAATAVCVPLSIYLAAHHPADLQFYSDFWLPVQMPVFLLGILAYRLWKPLQGSLRSLTETQRTWLTGGVVVLAFLLVLRVQGSRFVILSNGIAATAVLLALTLRPLGLLVNRVTRFYGKISYSMYLFHFFALYTAGWAMRRMALRDAGFTRRVEGHPLLVWAGLAAAVLLVSTPVCVVLWKYLEEPFIRLGRRVIARGEHRAAEHAARLIPSTAQLGSRRNTPDEQF